MPVIEGTLVELSGKRGAIAPLQNEGMALKVGVTLGITVTTMVVVVAHWPAVGVKV